ncbi:uncharacterized protein TA09520 [Theileria annulata]|uniref:Mitochondrial import receptor subunit TOM22 n=1 Tax=Theileria annulata TaxID=5874 RepID=Q4UJ15_THEAN|nr:uncharacterized protein TA09520 [Theileria annulata]CAI72924.1 hypothetical protein, conserved [Theileria annulata]|eukprot:XP_953602.1 hypothetical protein, conserved [Theileria annulata]
MRIEDSKENSQKSFMGRLAKAKRSLVRLTKKTINVTGWTVWIIGTAAVTLVGPVIFHYDKECHLLEIQHQLLQAQQSASVPVLN